MALLLCTVRWCTGRLHDNSIYQLHASIFSHTEYMYMLRYDTIKIWLDKKLVQYLDLKIIWYFGMQLFYFNTNKIWIEFWLIITDLYTL